MNRPWSYPGGGPPHPEYQVPPDTARGSELEEGSMGHCRPCLKPNSP